MALVQALPLGVFSFNNSTKSDMRSDLGLPFLNEACGVGIEKHQDSECSCALCFRSFSSKKVLANHIQLHSSKNSFPCPFCSQVYFTKMSLNKHMLCHKGEEGLFECAHCCDVFVNKEELARHVHSHIGEGIYKCSLCKKCFLTKSNLRHHLTSHPGEKPYKCPKCMKSYSLKSQLSVHVRSYSIEKPFRCSLCPKKYPLKSMYNRHKRTHFPSHPLVFPLRNFTAKWDFGTFMDTNQNKKCYKCEQCAKSFTKQSVFNHHIQYHSSSETQYECAYCSNSYYSKAKLTTHIRSHNGEKRPLLCTLRPNIFGEKSDLSKLILSHMDSLQSSRIVDFQKPDFLPPFSGK